MFDIQGSPPPANKHSIPTTKKLDKKPKTDKDKKMDFLAKLKTRRWMQLEVTQIIDTV